MGDIIDKAKQQFIHFYLRTRLQKQISDDHDDDDRQKEEEHDQNQVLVVHDKPGKITEDAEEDEHDSESSVSSPYTISCKVSKQSTESIDKPRRSLKVPKMMS